MKRMKTRLLISSATLLLSAYDNKPGWKKDDDGNHVWKDGNPVYLDSSGQEKTVDVGTIKRLNAEAQTNRESLEEANEKLKAFGDLDPVAAREAIKAAKDKPNKTDKGVDEAEVERRIEEALKVVRAENDTLKTEITTLTLTNESIVLDSAFEKSKYIKDNVAVPPDMFRKTFDTNFKVIDGKAVPVDANGKHLASPKRAGELATFDEGVEAFVERYDHKDSILKPEDKRGSQSKGGTNDSVKGATMKRSEYNSLDATGMGAAGAKIQKGELTLVND